MGRKANHQRISHGGTTLEHQSVVDDNLLPSADELVKLNSISPNILPWVLDRTEKEQDARIEFNQKRMNLAEYDVKKTHIYNFLSLTFAFAIILIGVACSFYFIINNHHIEGSLFAGGTIIIAIISFVNASKKNAK